MEPLGRRPFIAEQPLHVLTREFGEDGLRQRLSYKISQTEWGDEIRSNIRAAELLALEAHQNDVRGDRPYSTHFLRVTTRIISPHLLGVRDHE